MDKTIERVQFLLFKHFSVLHRSFRKKKQKIEISSNSSRDNLLIIGFWIYTLSYISKRTLQQQRKKHRNKCWMWCYAIASTFQVYFYLPAPVQSNIRWDLDKQMFVCVYTHKKTTMFACYFAYILVRNLTWIWWRRTRVKTSVFNRELSLIVACCLN